MLVVTANWSIGDGTAYGPPPRTAIATFIRELRKAAWRAGFRADGRYRPPDAVHLVLAGDTFDGLTTLAWQGGTRPWRGGPRCRAVADRIAEAATRQGARLLATLAGLRRNGLPIPAADARGRPTPAFTQPTPVSITCLVGDRDGVLDGRWFAAAGSRHGISIGTEQTSDALVIRHGSESDPLCGLPGMPAEGRPPTLGETLSVDLLGEFTRRLHAAATNPGAVAPLIRRLATAPPLQMPLVFSGSLSPGDHPSTAVPTAIAHDAWQRAVQYWHACARVTAPEAAVEHDVVDAVAAWMSAAVAPRPRPPEEVMTSLRARITAPAAGPLVVLGHPPPAALSPLANPAACICLGPDRSQDYGRTTGLDCPAAIAVADVAAPAPVWLASGPAAGRHADWRPHVTPVGVRSDGTGIVDAA